MEVDVDLHADLGRYLAEVRQGRSVVVTEGGCAFARLLPVRHAGPRIRKAERPKSPAPEPVVAAGSISELLKLGGE